MPALGVDTQHTLPFGSPEDARNEVAEGIGTFAPGGGFVFAPVQNIQPQVPIENVVTMFDSVAASGRYPIPLRESDKQ